MEFFFRSIDKRKTNRPLASAEEETKKVVSWLILRGHDPDTVSKLTTEDLKKMARALTHDSVVGVEYRGRSVTRNGVFTKIDTCVRIFGDERFTDEVAHQILSGPDLPSERGRQHKVRRLG